MTLPPAYGRAGCRPDVLPPAYRRGCNLGPPSASFISQWDTTITSAGSSAPNQLRPFFEPAGIVNALVNWGDGEQNFITAWDQPESTHTYAAPGIYTLSISGTVDGFRTGFGSTGERLKILDISQWGKLRVGNNGNYLHGCANLDITANDTPDLSGTSNLSFFLRDCISLVGNSSFNLWDVSDGVTARGMLQGTNLNQYIGSWNTSNWSLVLDFLSGNPIYNQPMPWNTGNFTDIRSMFFNLVPAAFDQPLLWDMRNVTKGTSFAPGVTLSTPNMDATYIHWAAQALQNNVIINMGNGQYSAGAAADARAFIVSNFNWTIQDGGQAP